MRSLPPSKPLTGQETLTLKANASGITCLAVSLDGKRIVSANTDDGTLKIWDPGMSQPKP